MKHYLPVITLFMIAGCGSADDDAARAPEPSAALRETGSTAFLSGAMAYDQVCARCHEDGVDGAPRTGEPQDWADRSPLWEAVLFEHAKTGWLDMPAKGGVDALDDPTVIKAAEHMLSITFPEARTDSGHP